MARPAAFDEIMDLRGICAPELTGPGLFDKLLTHRPTHVFPHQDPNMGSPVPWATTGAATTLDVFLPGGGSGMRLGTLVLILLSLESGATVTWPSGSGGTWNAIDGLDETNGGVRVEARWHIHDGTEDYTLSGGQITLSFSGSVRACAVPYAIIQHGSSTNPPQCLIMEGNDNSPQPPLLMPFKVMAEDGFTGTNGDPLSANWTEGGVSFEINTNRARPSAVDESSHAFFDAITWPSHQVAEVQVIDASGIANGTDNGVGCKLNVQSGSNGDFYYAILRNTTIEIKECDNNFSNSAGLASTTFAAGAGDILRFVSKPINPTTVELSVYIIRRGALGTTRVLGPITDSIHQGGDGGIFSRVAAADVVNDGLLDNFKGGEGGRRNFMWIAVEGHDGDSSLTTSPTAYIGTGQVNDTGGGDGMNLAWGHRLGYWESEDPGRFILSGPEDWVAATIAIFPGNEGDPSLSADSGSYTLSGQDATLLHGYSFDAAPGVYALTGLAASLLAGRAVSADSGVYVVAGQDAQLASTKLFEAAPGVYVITGQAAALLKGYELNAEAGSYAITGIAAELEYAAGSSDHPLVADPGVYLLVGQDATIIAQRLLSADPGTYALTGLDAALQHGYLIAGEAGSYVIAGQNAALVRDAMLSADPGLYSISGQAAAVTAGRAIDAQPGSYVITGAPATFTRNALLEAIAGSYIIAGGDAALDYSAAPPAAESGFPNLFRRRRRD